jgi:imidazolonepropionase
VATTAKLPRADFLLTNAGRLVTCSRGFGEGLLGVIEYGAFAAAEGEIIWVGQEHYLRGSVEIAPDAVEIDAGGGAVLPGFVDCHTHLVFAGDRSEEFAARLRGSPYSAGGVAATVSATRAADDDELRALALQRLERFASFGVTTVEAKTGYGLTPHNERRLLEIACGLDHPVELVPTYMGAHVIPEQYAEEPDEYVAMVSEQIPDVAGQAEFCDVWCDRGAFTLEQSRRILEGAREAGMKLKVHAEQFKRTGGAQLAAELKATSADHLEHATWEDAQALAEAGVVAVLLPGASLMTASPFAPARMLIERGARVALSTDFNPGSSYTENLQLMVALACIHLKMTPEEAILGITRHAAAAVAREGKAGSLEPGAAADLVVLHETTELALAYHYGVNLAARVFKRGDEIV